MTRIRTLQWSTFTSISLTVGIGVFVLAASLRVLFDEDYSYLLHEASGSYLPGYILVTIGTLLIFSGCIGCCAVVKSNILFLGLFSILIIITVVVEIVSGKWVYEKLDDFHEEVHFWIFWAIQRHYGNDVSNTTAIDLIQRNWKCCGLHSYSSWSNSLYSKRYVAKGIRPSNIFIIPKSCCIEPLSDECESLHLKGIRDSSSISSVLHTEGCGQKLLKVIDYYVSYLFGFGVGAILFQTTAAILCSVLLYRLVKQTHSIGFKFIKSPDSTTLLTGEPNSNVPPACVNTPSHYTTSKSSLVASDLPISSLV